MSINIHRRLHAKSSNGFEPSFLVRVEWQHDVASTIYQALHPASETWPKGHIQQMGFPASMPTEIEFLEAQVRAVLVRTC